MPCPSPKPILLHEASCLKGNTTPVRIAMIQPLGTLEESDSRGPHYNGGASHARGRFDNFLNLVGEEQASLAIAPEYFCPLSSVKAVLENSGRLRLDTIYVLPIETLHLEDYVGLITYATERSLQIECANLSGSDNATCINVCIILYRDETGLRVFLQPKTCAAYPEIDKLELGTEFFVLQGEHSALMTLLCADANLSDCHPTWTSGASQKPGAYILHLQFNPVPDYEHYRSLWLSTLNAANGDNRVVVSLNWAAGSQIVRNGQQQGQITRSRSRVFRGQCLQSESLYRQRSYTGLHLEHHQEGRKTWEVWHLLSPPEHCLVIDMVRPFENVAKEQASRDKGIRRSKYFEPSGEHGDFLSQLPNNLTRSFWMRCEEDGVQEEHYNHISDISLCDLERVCNSCLLREHGSWLMRDVDCRLPTLRLMCKHRAGDDCDFGAVCQDRAYDCYTERQHWANDFALFSQCLISFHTDDLSDTAKIYPLDRYPLNLDGGSERSGWLFHGQGWSARQLVKKIRYMLEKGQVLSTVRGSLYLCVVRPGESIKEIDIIDQPVDVSSPGKVGQDISADRHSPELIIRELT